MGVLRFLGAVLRALAVITLLVVGAIALLFLLPDGQGGSQGYNPGGGQSAPPRTVSQRLAPITRPILHPILAFERATDTGACFKDDAFKAPSADNTTGLTAAPVSPFGKAETGWAIYAPLAVREVATACGPETPAFAAALSRWQGAHALAPSGRMDAPTLRAMAMQWLLRRPFVRAMKTGCPASPNEQTLVRATSDEAWGGKAILLRPGTLEAYRRMVAAARAENELKPPALTLASGYRGPAEEAARCADGGCGNPAKAHCSAHRTGLAFDLYLDDKPGPAAFSTADGDRLRLSRSPAYLWLVKNADRFGFVPYPFEPWHWEWTGEAI